MANITDISSSKLTKYALYDIKKLLNKLFFENLGVEIMSGVIKPVGDYAHNDEYILVSDLSKFFKCHISTVRRYLKKSLIEIFAEKSRGQRKGIRNYVRKQELADKLGIENLDEPFILVEEAAKFLNITVNRLRILSYPSSTYSFKIPCYKLYSAQGAAYLYRKSELEEFSVFSIERKNDLRHIMSWVDNWTMIYKDYLDTTSISDKERDMVEAYFFERKSIEEIAENYNVTRERVRQLFVETMESLKDNFATKQNLMLKVESLEQENLQLIEELSLRHDETCVQSEAWKSIAKISIYDIDLSSRAQGCLFYANIRYLGDLSGYTKKDIRSFRGCGEKTFREIVAVLAGYRIFLKE